ncbi:hypothetical protein ICU98_03655 [Polynucleobacter sp. MWH-P3-07-1]|uniref:DUF5993 family protein n=1 Tax=Polynucleobacter sp. MWH-P3-07-1 TaxID=1743173 RepID=UPI001BFE92C4|nr:DUF5993 family protein [Polynucleobacter sp. MWH-P3-07-1]QWD84165.1 hypothetical protein ICU98_03655 [Polynucleobacter sp. MWH-P3-07-1]QWD92365.1 hypothetical protein ICV00_06560 [Polynucleobacter asymbioticus]
MYMFLPFLTAFLGLLLAWFEKRFAALVFLAMTVGILMYWFHYHATDALNISL